MIIITFFQRLLSYIQSRISGVFERFLKTYVLTNRKWYQGNCYGTDIRWVVALKNILRPARLMVKLRYRQIIPLPYFLMLASSIKKSERLDEKLFEEVKGITEQLHSDGIVVLPGRYRELSERIALKYGIDQHNYTPLPHYLRTWINPSEDEAIFDIFISKLILSILSHYYNCQPYIRHLPTINIAYPSLSLSEASKVNSEFASHWHFDTPNLLSAHLLLNEVSFSGTRMLCARKTHRTHRTSLSGSDSFYSDEYVRSHYEIVDCVGEPGTLIIFDNNALHRIELVKNSFRAQLEFYYTPGNNIIPTTQILKAQAKGFSVHSGILGGFQYRPESLSELQLNALKKIE